MTEVVDRMSVSFTEVLTGPRIFLIACCFSTINGDRNRCLVESSIQKGFGFRGGCINSLSTLHIHTCMNTYIIVRLAADLLLVMLALECVTVRDRHSNTRTYCMMHPCLMHYCSRRRLNGHRYIHTYNQYLYTCIPAYTIHIHTVSTC